MLGFSKKVTLDIFKKVMLDVVKKVMLDIFNRVMLDVFFNVNVYNYEDVKQMGDKVNFVLLILQLN